MGAFRWVVVSWCEWRGFRSPCPVRKVSQMLFPFILSTYTFSDEGERSREPLTWRGLLLSVLMAFATVVAGALVLHYFVVPNPLINDLEDKLTWHENKNTVTVYGEDGTEWYTLSGNCYVGDGNVEGSHPGPTAVKCYDGAGVFSYRVVEGGSVTVEKSGSSYGWERPRATIREAGSSHVYTLTWYRENSRAQ